MLVKMDAANAGGGGNTLIYADYYADINNANSVTVPNDYDAVMVVSSFTLNYDTSNYRPHYDGVTYEWYRGNKSSTIVGVSTIIPNVKANTSITFNTNINASIYGFNLT